MSETEPQDPAPIDPPDDTGGGTTNPNLNLDEPTDPDPEIDPPDDTGGGTAQ